MSRHYLTAQELGITHWEREALASVRVLLLAGRLELDMNYIEPEQDTCGTARCIGGWVQHLSPEHVPGTYVDGPLLGSLHSLYYPPLGAAWFATARQGADAIAAFLCGDRDPWPAVMAASLEGQTT